MTTYIFEGIATVTVSLEVKADTEDEAFAKAKDALPFEWTCDEVDGEVTEITLV